jgi:hypothetical protein
MATNARTDSVGAVAFVGGDDRPFLDSFNQRLGVRDVVVVARRDQELDRAALRVDACVDFRREPAPAAAYTTISTLSWGPEAC